MSRPPLPPPPAPPAPYGGHPAKHSGRRNLANGLQRIVIHSAVIPCEPGRARQLAAWNRAGTTGGSWHYSTDPGETLQCSWDSYVCHHAPPNHGSIGIEMCDWPAPDPGLGKLRRLAQRLRRLARKSWRWKSKPHRAMLERTARLTAELALAYDVPIVFLGPAQLRAGRRGLTTHAKVSLAFGQSTHWDPGFWPRRRFMRLVRRYADEIRAGAGPVP